VVAGGTPLAEQAWHRRGSRRRRWVTAPIWRIHRQIGIESLRSLRAALDRLPVVGRDGGPEASAAAG